LKLAVTNPTDEERAHENVVVRIADLKRIAPDFRASDCIVTTSDAATLADDARTVQVTELPSQADDLDGDNKLDELAFQIALKAGQTRIVTIAYGETATIHELRGNYSKRTAAKFTMKFDGLAWESKPMPGASISTNATPSTFTASVAPVSYLEMFGAPEYVYHWESPLGRDIYRIG